MAQHAHWAASYAASSNHASVSSSPVAMASISGTSTSAASPLPSVGRSKSTITAASPVLTARNSPVPFAAPTVSPPGGSVNWKDAAKDYVYITTVKRSYSPSRAVVQDASVSDFITRSTSASGRPVTSSSKQHSPLSGFGSEVLRQDGGSARGAFLLLCCLDFRLR